MKEIEFELQGIPRFSCYIVLNSVAFTVDFLFYYVCILQPYLSKIDLPQLLRQDPHFLDDTSVFFLKST